MTQELENGRRRARRRIAIASFVVEVILTLGILGGLLFKEDPTDFGLALMSAEGLLTTMLVTFTALILGYYGVSLTEKILGDKFNGFGKSKNSDSDSKS